MDYSNKDNKEYVSLLDDLISRDLTLETISEYGKSVILLKLKELNISEEQYIWDLPLRRIEFHKEMDEYFNDTILLMEFEPSIEGDGGFGFPNTPITEWKVDKKR